MGGFWWTLKIAKDHLQEVIKKHGAESSEAAKAKEVVLAFHKLARNMPVCFYRVEKESDLYYLGLSLMQATSLAN